MADSTKKVCNCGEECSCEAKDQKIEQLTKDLENYQKAYLDLQDKYDKLTYLYNSQVEAFFRYKPSKK